MHVHIHHLPVKGDEEDREGIAVLHHERAVALLDGLRDDIAPDEAAVHEVVLRPAVAPGDHGLSDVSGDLDSGRLGAYLQEIGRRVAPVKAVDDVLQGVVARGVHAHLPVHNELEGYAGVRQGHVLDQVAHRAGLRGGGAQEFLPCGHVVEKIPHDEGAALRGADLLKADLLPALYPVPAAHQGAGRLRDELHLGHRADARERFAAESQGRNAQKLVSGADLARRVGKKSRRDLGLLYPLPVVGDPDQDGAALADLTGDGAGAGVDRILHEFLDHGGRPLHDLAGRDLVDRLLREHTNFLHLVPPLRLLISGLLPAVLQPLLQPEQGVQGFHRCHVGQVETL